MFNKLKYFIIFAVSIMLFVVSGNIGFTKSINNNNFIENKELFKPIIEQIYKDYGKLYDFKNFEFETFNFTKDSEDYIGIDVFVDMTLIRHPKDNPYFKGELEALNNIEDKNLKLSLKNEIFNEIKEIEDECYNVTNRTTFTYAYKVNNGINKEISLIDNFSMDNYYYRTHGENITLTPANELEQIENEEASFKNGYDSLLNRASELSNNKDYSIYSVKSSVSYDRIAARDWARDNGYRHQEYSSKDTVYRSNRVSAKFYKFR